MLGDLTVLSEPSRGSTFTLTFQASHHMEPNDEQILKPFLINARQKYYISQQSDDYDQQIERKILKKYLCKKNLPQFNLTPLLETVKE